MVRVLVVLAVMVVVGTSGVLYAADVAMPIDTAATESSVALAQAGEPEDVCVGAYTHPVAEWLAEKYEVPYEEIMDWFCEGHYGFGEIVHALVASEETGIPPEELLAMKTELGGWGQVWRELGMKGKKDKDRDQDPDQDQDRDQDQDQDQDKDQVQGKDKVKNQDTDQDTGQDKEKGKDKGKSKGKDKEKPAKGKP